MTDVTNGRLTPTIQRPDTGLDFAKFTAPVRDLPKVDTIQTGLPIHKLAAANDFVRVHPTLWTPELCFMNVPIKGARKESLHLITQELVIEYMLTGKVKYYTLALASKPSDALFLAMIPTRNPDNEWNRTTLIGAEEAKTKWVQLISRAEEGIDGYVVRPARDATAFPDPKWTDRPMSEIIGHALKDRTIDRADHPSLLRIIGGKQAVGS